MSDYIKYEVHVHPNGAKHWFLNGNLHREDGPAIESPDGEKYWYLEGEELTEEEFNARVNTKNSSCSGKVVEIDGIKYKLELLE